MYYEDINSSQWVSTSNNNSVAVAGYGSVPPSSPAVGQLFFDTDDSKLKLWTGSGWSTSNFFINNLLWHVDFPSGQPNGTVWTDSNTGTQWVYDSGANSWTSKGLVNNDGITYEGSVDITAAPPTGVVSGEMYSVEATGTANSGYTGLAGYYC